MAPQTFLLSKRPISEEKLPKDKSLAVETIVQIFVDNGFLERTYIPFFGGTTAGYDSPLVVRMIGCWNVDLFFFSDYPIFSIIFFFFYPFFFRFACWNEDLELGNRL